MKGWLEETVKVAEIGLERWRSGRDRIGEKRIRMAKRTKFSLYMVFLGMLLCGFIFSNPEMTLDTEKNIVYQHYSMDKILSDFAVNADLAKENYHKARIVLWGNVDEIDLSGQSVSLASTDGGQRGSIKCSFSSQESMEDVKALSKGDRIKVYGEFSVSLVGGKLSVRGVKIEKTSADFVSDACYSLISGRTIDRERMYVRTLADNKITYYIPAEWSKVEYNIADNHLGSIEGFQYRLNEIPSSASVRPESFFVCYFDNKLLKNPSERNKTDLIERAIAANILGKDPDSLDKFPAKKTETYYGAKYHYYQDAYRDALGQGYHAEFVFQPVNTEGIIVYLYLYHDVKHLDDMMCLMRLMEVE